MKPRAPRVASLTGQLALAALGPRLYLSKLELQGPPRRPSIYVGSGGSELHSPGLCGKHLNEAASAPASRGSIYGLVGRFEPVAMVGGGVGDGDG